MLKKKEFYKNLRILAKRKAKLSSFITIFCCFLFFAFSFRWDLVLVRKSVSRAHLTCFMSDLHLCTRKFTWFNERGDSSFIMSINYDWQSHMFVPSPFLTQEAVSTDQKRPHRWLSYQSWPRKCPQWGLYPTLTSLRIQSAFGNFQLVLCEADCQGRQKTRPLRSLIFHFSWRHWPLVAVSVWKAASTHLIATLWSAKQDWFSLWQGFLCLTTTRIVHWPYASVWSICQPCKTNLSGTNFSNKELNDARCA